MKRKCFLNYIFFLPDVKCLCDYLVDVIVYFLWMWSLLSGIVGYLIDCCQYVELLRLRVSKQEVTRRSWLFTICENKTAFWYFLQICSTNIYGTLALCVVLKLLGGRVPIWDLLGCLTVWRHKALCTCNRAGGVSQRSCCFSCWLLLFLTHVLLCFVMSWSVKLD